MPLGQPWVSGGRRRSRRAATSGDGSSPSRRSLSCGEDPRNRQFFLDLGGHTITTLVGLHWAGRPAVLGRRLVGLDSLNRRDLYS